MGSRSGRLGQRPTRLSVRPALDGAAFLAQVQADILKGAYVDPDAGRVTFRKYADEWLSAASCDESTRERLERQFRLHVYPVFGDRPLSAVQPNTIRAWAKQLQDSGMAASYRRNLFNDVSMILNAAVDDRKVISNPCALKTVRAPRYVPAKVVPWSTERLASFRSVMQERYRVAVDLGAGCGLRQGEIFAVSPEDVDTSRRLLHVVRQIKIRAAGIEDTRQNGMHVLRHTYASVLLDAGENIKALSLYLGHADPGFTLRVYTHLLPTSEDPPSDRRRLRVRPNRPRRPGDGLAGCRKSVCAAQEG